MKTLIGERVQQIVAENDLPVESAEKIDTRLVHFEVLEQHLAELARQGFEGGDDTMDLERSKELADTIQYVMDKDLNLEDVTTKED